MIIRVSSVQLIFRNNWKHTCTLHLNYSFTRFSTLAIFCYDKLEYTDTNFDNIHVNSIYCIFNKI